MCNHPRSKYSQSWGLYSKSATPNILLVISMQCNIFLTVTYYSKKNIQVTCYLLDYYILHLLIRGVARIFWRGVPTAILRWYVTALLEYIPDFYWNISIFIKFLRGGSYYFCKSFPERLWMWALHNWEYLFCFAILLGISNCCKLRSLEGVPEPPEPPSLSPCLL